MDHDPAAASRMDPERERALVARSRIDASAFGDLYDFYLPRIFGFVIRRVRDRAIAEDLTAMTFERALGIVRRQEFRNESFGGWLYRVAANAVVDHVRNERRTRPPEPARGWSSEAPRDDDREGAIGDESAARALAATLDRDVLRRALLVLPENHRRILVLRFLDGLEPDELCSVLVCSRATLAVRLHRALRALRDAVAREDTDAA
jgi:RNA polymerase sigma-70 factor (ECF subfamily)